MESPTLSGRARENGRQQAMFHRSAGKLPSGGDPLCCRSCPSYLEMTLCDAAASSARENMTFPPGTSVKLGSFAGDQPLARGSTGTRHRDNMLTLQNLEARPACLDQGSAGLRNDARPVIDRKSVV